MRQSSNQLPRCQSLADSVLVYTDRVTESSLLRASDVPLGLFFHRSPELRLALAGVGRHSELALAGVGRRSELALQALTGLGATQSPASQAPTWLRFDWAWDSSRLSAFRPPFPVLTGSVLRSHAPPLPSEHLESPAELRPATRFYRPRSSSGPNSRTLPCPV